uniref:Uncharacterized protein n=1 Tax=Triticum urartu TaxID=4572 RepID=A0A8R7QW55_TRIUA
MPLPSSLLDGARNSSSSVPWFRPWMGRPRTRQPPSHPAPIPAMTMPNPHQQQPICTQPRRLQLDGGCRLAASLGPTRAWHTWNLAAAVVQNQRHGGQQQQQSEELQSEESKHQQG